jgi:hypothetical protein
MPGAAITNIRAIAQKTTRTEFNTADSPENKRFEINPFRKGILMNYYTTANQPLLTNQ